MNLQEQAYFELGKLNIILKHIRKNQFLLPMIVRQGVLALCSTGVKFETLFSPNVADNATKDVLLIVKQIKTINQFIAKDNFSIEDVKSIATTLDKKLDLKYLDEIDFSLDLPSLFGIAKSINQSKSSFGNLILSTIINIFLCKAGFVGLPILDVSFALNKQKIDVIDDFYKVIITACNSTETIIEKQKQIVKTDRQNAEKSQMKSVSLVYEYLLESPVVEVGVMLDDIEMTFATLSKATSVLVSKGILTQIAGNQRYRIFKYDALCNLFGN